MSGIQEVIALALAKIKTDVEFGKYGTGDDFDYESFCDDIEDDVMALAP